MANDICKHIVHAFQSLARYYCDETKLKITNWMMNLQESVEQDDSIRERFPNTSNYALVDRFLRLSNYSIGPPYSVDELRFGFAKLLLEWDTETEYPKVYHKQLIESGSLEDNVRSTGTKLIRPATMEESAGYKRYEERLSTFKNFPCNFINVNTLAAIGFFFVPDMGEDVCKCAFCGVCIGNFYGSMAPRQLHSLFSPFCPASDMLDAFFDHY